MTKLDLGHRSPELIEVLRAAELLERFELALRDVEGRVGTPPSVGGVVEE